MKSESVHLKSDCFKAFSDIILVLLSLTEGGHF